MGVSGAGIGVFLGAALGGRWEDNWRIVAGTAGMGSFLGFVIVLLMVWDISLRWMQRQPAQPEPDIDSLPEFYRESENHLLRVTEPPFDDRRKMERLRQWFKAIHLERATLSQDGTRDRSMLGGRAWEFTPEECTAIKEWCIEAGWYRWTNEANGTGAFTERGRRALEMIAREVAWDRVLSRRPFVAPAP